MLQVRKIYQFIPSGETQPVKNDKALEPDIAYKNISDVLANLHTAISPLADKDRENLFLTLWHQSEDTEQRKKKVWGRQELLLFDIDIKGTRDVERDGEYLSALAAAIRVPESKILQIFSGHGYHCAIQLDEPITDRNYFSENKIYYQVLCSRINDELRERGLSGEADAEVFAPNRLLRLPLSFNKKKDMPKVPVELLQSHIEPVAFDVRKASGMPVIDDKAYMSEKELSYIKTDAETVEKECDFLVWARENQHDVNEAQWYAMLSIVRRLKDGERKIHDYSKYHPSYDEHQTNKKAEQSLKASGPRTCDNINSLWQGCGGCKHFKKCRSPITIKGKDFIATSHSGFHIQASNGRLVPQYDDLRKYYDKEIPYKNIARAHYRYNGKHWEEHDDVFIENYAEENFVPAPKNTICNEFKGKVKRTNLGRPEWFSDSTNRKINLQNGVLDIDTMELKEHDKKFGFKSVLPFEFKPKAQCPTFERMLRDVTLGDETLQANLLEYIGYCISNDDPRADKILVLTGEGQNGKSRFLNVARAMGGSAVTSLGVRDLQNAFHLQQLDGALFNILEEVPSFTDKDVWELIKGLVTGAAVTASRKFKDPYTFCNKAKFVMTCNELPKGANPNHGFFRRLLIVPFKAKFSHELGNIDVNIDQRIIENELPGVFNMVLEAYHRLREREYQFTQSNVVQAALDEYKSDMDSVARFVEDCVVLSKEPMTDIGSAPDWIVKDSDGRNCADLEEMYQTYAQRCKKFEERPMAFRGFTKRLYTILGSVELSGQQEPLSDKPSHRRARIDGQRRRIMYGVTWYDESLC